MPRQTLNPGRKHAPGFAPGSRGIERNCRPCWQSATSKLASGQGSRAASAYFQMIVAAFGAGDRALPTASIAGLISIATTFSIGPTSGAARATTLVPAARASMRSPGRGAAAASNTAAYGWSCHPTRNDS